MAFYAQGRFIIVWRTAWFLCNSWSSCFVTCTGRF